VCGGGGDSQFRLNTERNATASELHNVAQNTASHKTLLAFIRSFLLPKLQSCINIRNIVKAETGGKEEVCDLHDGVSVAILGITYKTVCYNKRLQLLRIFRNTS
jgi:hypothetical protein